MSANHKTQYDYQASLLSEVPITSTWEIAIHLSVEIESDMWFIVIDRWINLKEERMMYHRKEQNTVFVYWIQRSLPVHHDVGALVILDAVWSINYWLDNTFQQMYIYQKSLSDIVVKGWEFYINGNRVVIPDLDTELWTQHLTPWTENNIYIKDNEYFITTDDVDTDYLVWIIYVDVWGNILNIDMVRQLMMGNWLSDSDKLKLDWLNSDLYEKLSNKTSIVRDALLSDDTKYPTEKAVATELELKVDKVAGMWLSHNSFTTQEKTLLNELWALNLNDIDFSKLHSLRQNIRDISDASTEEWVSELGIATKLWDYVLKDWDKVLSDNNFSDSDKEKLNNAITSLNNIDNTEDVEITAWVWIWVNDLWNWKFNIESTLESWDSSTSEYINIEKMWHSTELYLDEQKYVVLWDKMRSWFGWATKFKNWKDPIVKVFYFNPNNAGKLLIDTHTRVVSATGISNEVHKSIPYQVDIVQWHWVFELKEETFEWLNFINSNTMYIRVNRVWAFVTDVHWSEFNTVLDDLDTVVWEIRIKSMYIDYTSTTLVSWSSWFTWELKWGNCKPIAIVENGLIKSQINDKTIIPNPLSNWIIWIDTEYILTNISELRVQDADTITDNQLVDIIWTLINDLYEVKLFQNVEVTDDNIMTQFNVLNHIDDKVLDKNSTNINEIVDVLWTLIDTMKQFVSWCWTGILALPMPITINWDITNAETSRMLDVTTANYQDYINFIATLIEDLKSSNIFNWQAIEKTNKEFLVFHNQWTRTIDNSNNTLNIIWELIFDLILDLKKTNIIY